MTAMSVHDLAGLLAAHRRDLDRLGVRQLAVFGSTARGEARPDSDVDVLVSFRGTATFDRYIELKFFLEDLLQRQVDLVNEKSVKPALRPHIEADAIRVA